MIPEEEESESSRSSRGSHVSLPTEYGQSYRPTSSALRPRSCQGGWQARNLSNILPSSPEPPPRPARPMRGRPANFPWLTRQTSQIFPPTNDQIHPQDGPADNRRIVNDVNNNPVFDTGRPRRRQYPWQVRAQSSSIFYSDAITSPSLGTQSSSRPRPQSAPSKWPWVERAKKSVIFDVITSKEPEKQPQHRKYKWDQRQSTSISACIQQEKDEQLPSSSTSRSHCQQWPWQERAQKSVVFNSPEAPTQTRQPKYMWDQRKTRFSVKLDPDSQFSQGSYYTDNYSKWQKVQSDRMKPAGKPCYKEEDLDLDSQRKSKSGKRRAKNKPIEKKGSGGSVSVILPLPAPPSPPSLEIRRKGSSLGSSTSIKASSCMEIVPADFDFSAVGVAKNNHFRPKS